MDADPAAGAMRAAFLKWQCLIRQASMRESAGRPGPGIAPSVRLDGEDAPMGRIVTVLNKAPERSATPEMRFIAERTHDPAQRREKAVEFLSSTHYQSALEFSDILTATFPPDSPGAARIRRAKRVILEFDAHSQRYDLNCKAWRLAARNPLRQSTMAHNQLFNPDLHPDSVVLGFEPDWSLSRADPAPR